MEDEELARARRALHEVDPELDLPRAYAESWARVHGTRPHGAHPHDASGDDTPRHGAAVEILLRAPGSGPRRHRPAVRRGPVLLWATAAAAAAVLVVGVVNTSAPSHVPGWPPATTSASTGPGSAPDPSPTLGSTPDQVVLQVAKAVNRTRCDVTTRSTLGDESRIRFDGNDTRDTETPPLATLDQAPLQVLQDVATTAVLGLSNGADHGLQEDLRLEEVAGEILVRIRFSPPAGLVRGGEVTRIDLLVEPATWLPSSEKTWAESDAGEQYVLHSDFFWTSCGEPSPPTTTDDDAG